MSPGLEWFYRNRCGVVEGRVSLFHAQAKMLMLDDERVIAFDSCSVASDVDDETAAEKLSAFKKNN